MSDLVYGLRPIKNGTDKSTIQGNISDLKEYIKFNESQIRQAERDILKFQRIIQANKDRLEIEKTNLQKCKNSKFVK